MVVNRAEYSEFTWVVDGCLYPEYTAFVIHFDAVGLQLELHPAGNGTFFIVGDSLSLKPRVRFASHKGKDIGAREIIKYVTNQRGEISSKK